MFSFHLILSLFGFVLASCGLRITTPVLSDVSAPSAPLFAENVRKDAITFNQETNLYSYSSGYDAHSVLWQEFSYDDVDNDVYYYPASEPIRELVVDTNVKARLWFVDSFSFRIVEPEAQEGTYFSIVESSVKLRVLTQNNDSVMMTPFRLPMWSSFSLPSNNSNYTLNCSGLYCFNQYYNSSYHNISWQTASWGVTYNNYPSSAVSYLRFQLDDVIACVNDYAGSAVDFIGREFYQLGYDAYPWEEVADDNYRDGYNEGIAAGRDQGYARGYNDGQASVTTESGTLLLLFGSIADVPIAVLEGLGGLVIWNTPIISIIISLLFVALIVWVIKRFI